MQTPSYRRGLGWVMACLIMAATEVAGAASFDQLTDLTDKVVPTITRKNRDNFPNEYRFDITVRNMSSDPIIGDSLIIVLDRITTPGGEDREPLYNESNLNQFEILGKDGDTDDGKPFFRVPMGNAANLLPQTASRPVIVKLKNLNYLAMFTPVFRVYGQKRLPPEPKRAEATAAPAAQTASPGNRAAAEKLIQLLTKKGMNFDDDTVDKLVQLLIKKGVITEDEWRRANQP